jgi:hypothetical protein
MADYSAAFKTMEQCVVCSTDAELSCPCGVVRYCGRSCQKRDWAEHKPTCMRRSLKHSPLCSSREAEAFVDALKQASGLDVVDLTDTYTDAFPVDRPSKGWVLECLKRDREVLCRAAQRAEDNPDTIVVAFATSPVGSAWLKLQRATQVLSGFVAGDDVTWKATTQQMGLSFTEPPLAVVRLGAAYSFVDDLGSARATLNALELFRR